MCPGLRKKLDKVKHLKASMRAKVHHPFWVIKRQFRSFNARYRRLKKSTARHGTSRHVGSWPEKDGMSSDTRIETPDSLILVIKSN